MFIQVFMTLSTTTLNSVGYTSLPYVVPRVEDKAGQWKPFYLGIT